jgi:hypothetical protein
VIGATQGIPIAAAATSPSNPLLDASRAARLDGAGPDGPAYKIPLATFTGTVLTPTTANPLFGGLQAVSGGSSVDGSEFVIGFLDPRDSFQLGQASLQGYRGAEPDTNDYLPHLAEVTVGSDHTATISGGVLAPASQLQWSLRWYDADRGTTYRMTLAGRLATQLAPTADISMAVRSQLVGAALDM